MSQTAESMVALVLHELKEQDEVTIFAGGQSLKVIDAHIALDFPDILFCTTTQHHEFALNPSSIDFVKSGYAASQGPMPTM